MNFNETINDIAIKAASDEKVFEGLLNSYMPYILSQASQTLKTGYLDIHDDYASVAIIAFYESVKAYRPERGSFLAFAATVIKHRIVDQIRKESKFYSNNPPLEFEINEDTGEHGLADNSALEHYYETLIKDLRKLEIEALTHELSHWGITFEHIFLDSPRQEKTKDELWQIIHYILSEEAILKSILKKKTLPIKTISENLTIHRKKLERSRRYILACIIIILGDYPLLRDYMRLEGKW